MKDKELLRKQIIYRSTHRGTKEMDLLIGNFAKKYLYSLEEKDLKDMLLFLNIDDKSLNDYYMNTHTKINFKKSKILKLFRNFKFN